MAAAQEAGGGPGGEYAPEEYGLRYRDPSHSGR